MNAEIEQVVKFHGHLCPAVLIGYRVAKAAMERLAETRSKDEEIGAIVENNACGVDAVQYMTGCTFGKGNLIFRDYGKQVYTFFSRKTGKGLRVVFHGEGMPASLGGNREALTEWLMNADEKDVICIQEVAIDEPEPVRIKTSVKCDFCGEAVTETRTRKIGDKTACIPCAQKQG